MVIIARALLSSDEVTIPGIRADLETIAALGTQHEALMRAILSSLAAPGARRIRARVALLR
jgi:hypothetical protein